MNTIEKLNWCNFLRIAHARVPISCSVSLAIDVCSLLNVQESEKVFHTLINWHILAAQTRRLIFATIFNFDRKSSSLERKTNLIDSKSLNYRCLYPLWARGMLIFMQILNFCVVTGWYYAWKIWYSVIAIMDHSVAICS